MPNNTQADNVVTPRSPEEVEHIVVLERLHRYNYGLPCGAAALRRHLREEMDRLPASAHVPEAKRRHLSLTDSYGR